jgi:hypothetical protein
VGGYKTKKEVDIMADQKFSDLSPKEELARIKEELSRLIAGVYRRDGCDHNICSTKIVTSLCDQGAICTSGVGPKDEFISDIEQRATR